MGERAGSVALRGGGVEHHARTDLGPRRRGRQRHRQPTRAHGLARDRRMSVAAAEPCRVLRRGRVFRRPAPCDRDGERDESSCEELGQTTVLRAAASLSRARRSRASPRTLVFAAGLWICPDAQRTSAYGRILDGPGGPVSSPSLLGPIIRTTRRERGHTTRAGCGVQATMSSRACSARCATPSSSQAAAALANASSADSGSCSLSR